MCWCVGMGSYISIFNDAWIFCSINYRLTNSINVSNLVLVDELIDSHAREWKIELVTNTFDSVDAERILRIPLARDSHDDELVWSGEPLGDFSIRSAYKLLQTGISNPN